MKESIGVSVIINIIVVFLILTFVFMAAAVSYNKAFKVNSRIVNVLEKFEGYNYLAKEELDLMLGSIGYKVGSSDKCPNTKNDGDLVKASSFVSHPSQEKYLYCIYYYENDGDSSHFSYGVTTYLDIDIPIITGLVRVPIYSKTRRIWRFDVKQQKDGFYEE